MPARSTDITGSASGIEHHGPISSGTPDRRVRRTREHLRAALMELMQEKSYSAITISDLLARADVGRSTFYAHYRDKDDLLLSGFDDIRAALVAERQRAAGDLLEPVRAVFRHVETHRQVAMRTTRLSGALPATVAAELRELSEALLREHLRHHVRPDADPLAVEAATQFLVGALVGLLDWWTTHDVPYSADEMFKAFRRIATQGIRRGLLGPARS